MSEQSICDKHVIFWSYQCENQLSMTLTTQYTPHLSKGHEPHES